MAFEGRNGWRGCPYACRYQTALTRLVQSPDTSEPGTREFFNDWAGLAFLEQITSEQPSLAPRFYGGDKTLGMIVLEDLGDRLVAVEINGEMSEESSSLIQPLLGTDAAVATNFLKK